MGFLDVLGDRNKSARFVISGHFAPGTPQMLAYSTELG